MLHTRVVASVTSIVLATTLISTPNVYAQSTSVRDLVMGVGADDTSLNFSWVTLEAGQQYLRIAETDNPDSSRDIPVEKQIYNAAVYHSNEVTVDGLKPATSYTYQAGSDALGWTEPVEFTTDDGDDAWNFITMSDAQIGVDGIISEQAANWDKATVTAFERFPDSTMLLHLGDQVEGWGLPVKQYEEFAKPTALKRYPTAVLEGNHETYAPLSHFHQRFHLPNEVGESSNYFFERNNMLFIGLNSNENDAASIEKHARFIRATIAEHGADKDWIVVGMHHAVYSQGSHNSDAEVQRLRDGLAPVFTKEGVDLVLAGHDHIYTRSHLMEGTSPVEPEKLPERGDALTPSNGQVLYVTVTTVGGGKYYDFHDSSGTARPNLRREFVAGTDDELPATAYWRQDYTPDYTNVQVTPETLTLTTYNVNTPYVVDKVTLSKEQAPVEEPTEPSEPAEPNEPTEPAKPVQPAASGSIAGSSDGGAIALTVAGIVAVLAAVGGFALQSGMFDAVLDQLGIRR